MGRQRIDNSLYVGSNPATEKSEYSLVNCFLCNFNIQLLDLFILTDFVLSPRRQGVNPLSKSGIMVLC